MIAKKLERLNIGNKEHQMQHVLSVEVGCLGNMRLDMKMTLHIQCSHLVWFFSDFGLDLDFFEEICLEMVRI